MKPRYRFKGKFGNGERKVVVEYLENNKLKTFTLPKAGTLKNVLEKLKNPKGLEDVKNRALGAPLVNKK
ncbi:MAG TPA: hypothetical protein VMZ91_11555 [Candidatus Paceibacterota bacterium]|nr:hypothetical protein [Candidatus Paceibacterota bacterium]